MLNTNASRQRVTLGNSLGLPFAGRAPKSPLTGRFWLSDKSDGGWHRPSSADYSFSPNNPSLGSFLAILRAVFFTIFLSLPLPLSLPFSLSAWCDERLVDKFDRKTFSK
jgi:hypothetical protein